jgi:hypothetical protein
LIPVIAVIELGKITAEYAAEIVPVLAGMEEAQVRMDEHAADLEEYEKARLRTGNTSDILRGLHQLDRVLESTPPEDKKAIQDKISVLLAAREEKLALYESEVKSSRDALAPIERFGASFEDPAYRDPDARYAHMLENNLLTPKDIQDWREAGRNLEKKDDLLAKFIEQIQDRRAELMRKRDFGEAELDQLRHAVDTPSARRATKT